MSACLDKILLKVKCERWLAGENTALKKSFMSLSTCLPIWCEYIWKRMWLILDCDRFLSWQFMFYIYVDISLMLAVLLHKNKQRTFDVVIHFAWSIGKLKDGSLS